MIKYVLAAGMVVGIASAAVAVPQDKKDKTPETIKCAVMTGNPVNIKAATDKKMYADYKGKRYFFCCGGCPGQFKANPAKFAKSESIAIPKAAPKGKKA